MDPEKENTLTEHLTNNYLNTVRFVDVIEIIRHKALVDVKNEVGKMNDLEKDNLLSEIERQLKEQQMEQVEAALKSQGAQMADAPQEEIAK
jgi:hypothetical protein